MEACGVYDAEAHEEHILPKPKIKGLSIFLLFIFQPNIKRLSKNICCCPIRSGPVQHHQAAGGGAAKCQKGRATKAATKHRETGGVEGKNIGKEGGQGSACTVSVRSFILSFASKHVRINYIARVHTNLALAIMAA